MTFPALAGEEKNSAFNVTGLAIPRFVSLGSDEVFMRTGPGQKYPITWQYKRKNLPVEIVMEFDVWRKIRDSEGEQGWVHHSLLSGKRYGLVMEEGMTPLLRDPKKGARLMAYIEKGAVVRLEECRPDWCRATTSGYSGWIERKSIWGIYDNENIN